jgi:hypothetical protein
MGSMGPRGSTSAANYGPNANLQLYAGIFGNRSKVKVIAVKDGSSNTLMFGEGLGQITNGNQDFIWEWICSYPMPTRRGIAPDPKNVVFSQFASMHTGVVQFCFGDGSVRAVRPGNSNSNNNYNPASSDWWVLQTLGGKADGDPRDVTSLLN